MLDDTNLFSVNNKKNNEKIIYISILRANMPSLVFRLRKIDGTRNSLLEKIKHNDFMSEKHKKICMYLNYVEHLSF